MGIGGVVTFKNSGLDQTLKGIPLQQLLLETDSPYLAPTPYRGKRNESSYLLLIAQKLAEIYQISIEEVGPSLLKTQKNYSEYEYRKIDTTDLYWWNHWYAKR